jgi:hypothetical protein
MVLTLAALRYTHMDIPPMDAQQLKNIKNRLFSAVSNSGQSYRRPIHHIDDSDTPRVPGCLDSLNIHVWSSASMSYCSSWRNFLLAHKEQYFASSPQYSDWR